MNDRLFSATVVTMSNGDVEMRIGNEIRSMDAYLAACPANEIAAGRDGEAEFTVVANGLTRDQVNDSLLAQAAAHGCTHVRPAGKPAWAV